MSLYEFCHSLITFCKLFAYRFNTSFTNFKCTLHFKNIHWDITFLMLDYGKSLSNATNTGVIHDSHTTTNIIRPWYHQVEKWNSFWHADISDQISVDKMLKWFNSHLSFKSKFIFTLLYFILLQTINMILLI